MLFSRSLIIAYHDKTSNSFATDCLHVVSASADTSKAISPTCLLSRHSNNPRDASERQRISNDQKILSPPHNGRAHYFCTDTYTIEGVRMNCSNKDCFYKNCTNRNFTHIRTSFSVFNPFSIQSTVCSNF